MKLRKQMKIQNFKTFKIQESLSADLEQAMIPTQRYNSTNKKETGTHDH